MGQIDALFFQESPTGRAAIERHLDVDWGFGDLVRLERLTVVKGANTRLTPRGLRLDDAPPLRK